MIRVLHFVESRKDLPSDWETSLPDLKKGAMEYAEFLMEEDRRRTEWDSSHESLYMSRYYPIVEDIHTNEHLPNYHIKKHTLICLERLLGEEMFMEMKWNTPEVQSAYNKSKVAGADYYKQFESNPDLATDILDGISDPVIRCAESKKIEEGIKRGKYENDYN